MHQHGFEVLRANEKDKMENVYSSEKPFIALNIVVDPQGHEVIHVYYTSTTYEKIGTWPMSRYTICKQTAVIVQKCNHTKPSTMKQTVNDFSKM